MPAPLSKPPRIYAKEKGRRSVPPREKCRQCGRAVTALYRQRREGKSSFHRPTQYVECEGCGKVYVVSSMSEVNPDAITRAPPDGGER